MVTDFFVELERMAGIIDRHPLLEVVAMDRAPGLRPEALRRVETELNASLDPGIKAFYMASNGLTFRWKIKDGVVEELIDELMDLSTDYELEYPDLDENPLAQIRLLPLEDALLHINWTEELSYVTDAEKVIVFAGTSYPAAAFWQQLKPFDLFSDYDCMAFFLEKGKGDPKVLWLTNSYVSWQHSLITNFSSYLHFLLATFGITAGREKHFYVPKGHEKASLIWNDNYPDRKELLPKIFKNSLLP